MRKSIITKIRVSKGGEDGEQDRKLKEGLELRGPLGIILLHNYMLTEWWLMLSFSTGRPKQE